MIELETGDPWKKDNKPASSSRFLLPFSYTLDDAKHLRHTTDRLHFKEVQTTAFDRERLLYFTAETANVLFRRAIWAEVDADLWHDAGFSGPFRFKPVSRHRALAVPVMLAPPRLVLFEGQADNRSCP